MVGFKQGAEMKILHLVLKYKWFDMIKSGEKKEEYRDPTKYWAKRLESNREDLFFYSFKHYDAIRFQRGYTSPEMMLVECKEICFGKGQEKWGAEPNKKYYVIKLGEILEQK